MRVKITLMDHADQLLLHQLRGFFCEGEDHTDGPCRSVNVTSNERHFCEDEDDTDGPCRSVIVTLTERLLPSYNLGLT